MTECNQSSFGFEAFGTCLLLVSDYVPLTVQRFCHPVAILGTLSPSPVPVCRNSFVDTLATHRPAITSGHVGGDPSFVGEDQAFRIQLSRYLPPEFPLGPDPLTVLLGGAERLFLKRSPNRFRITHNYEWPI
jgi:hypothetical protein